MASAKSARFELFVVVKGHAFSRDAFEAMLRAVGVEPTFVDQPAAAMLLNPEAMRRYDAILFYDMPGLDFRAPVAERPAFVEPEPAFRAGFEALLGEGKGIVALHHAIAGWPAWPAYAAALGGQFLYKPAAIEGRLRGDLGFAADVTYTARIADKGHPVLAGLPDRFALTDELYRQELLDDGTVDLCSTSTAPSRTRGSNRRCARCGGSTPGEGEPWVAPPPNPLIGWAKAAGASPLVYLQPGDSPATYANPDYRRLVGNAVRWVASPAAREWAAARRRP